MLITAWKQSKVQSEVALLTRWQRCMENPISCYLKTARGSVAKHGQYYRRGTLCTGLERRVARAPRESHASGGYSFKGHFTSSSRGSGKVHAGTAPPIRRCPGHVKAQDRTTKQDFKNLVESHATSQLEGQVPDQWLTDSSLCICPVCSQLISNQDPDHVSPGAIRPLATQFPNS